MELSTKPILPGSFVVVKDTNSIYRGYKGFVPVSYTHLRAHETLSDLVCRLLLEKKKIM